jgi:hypothetical protein
MPAVTISGEMNVTFVHIPKCAGTSIGRWIDQRKGNSTYFERYDHPTLKMLTPATDFSFTVVRNPWERMVSFYHFLSKVESATPHFTSEQIQWIVNETNKAIDWTTFDKWLGNIEQFKVIPGWWFKVNEPQTSWYKDVDLVLRYENLEEEFKQVQALFKNYDPLPKTLVTDHTNYQNYYNSATKDLVTKMFQEEIETLGYKF